VLLLLLLLTWKFIVALSISGSRALSAYGRDTCWICRAYVVEQAAAAAAAPLAAA
jgi:hypothetical protein